MAEHDADRPIDAEDARQGHIVLRTRRRRLIFFGGLLALTVVLVLLRAAG